jgi:hypothetical protein
MISDLVPGAVFPDFRLPDHTHTPRRLSTLQGDDPMVLTLTLERCLTRCSRTRAGSRPCRTPGRAARIVGTG